MRLSSIGLIAILFLMPGCGGNGNSQTANLPAPLATRLRTVQPGDQWNYNITGQNTDANGKLVPFTGTLTLAMSTAPFNGASVLALTANLTLTDGSTPSTLFNTVVYLRQNAGTGDILELGDNGMFGGGNQPLVTPQIIYPGVWSNSAAINTTLDFGNGNTQPYVLTVVGSSTVNTPVGNYAVWVANGDPGSGTTTMWAPQLGAPVKITMQGGLLGTGGSATAILQSTTVPH